MLFVGIVLSVSELDQERIKKRFENDILPIIEREALKKAWPKSHEKNIYDKHCFSNRLAYTYWKDLPRFIELETQINQSNRDELKKQFSKRNTEVCMFSQPNDRLYNAMRSNCEKRASIEMKRIIARNLDLENLKREYRERQSNQANLSNLINAAIGAGTIAITLATAGATTPLFWLNIVGGSIGVIGNLAQICVRLSDIKEVVNSSSLIITDFTDIIFCSITYKCGDSQTLQSTNAIVDVGEATLFFLIPKPSLLGAINVVVQGLEVIQQFQD